MVGEFKVCEMEQNFTIIIQSMRNPNSLLRTPSHILKVKGGQSTKLSTLLPSTSNGRILGYLKMLKVWRITGE